MRKLWLVCLALLVAPVGATTLVGCSDKTDCTAMKKKFDQCADELWNTLEPQLRGRASRRWKLSKNEQHFRACKRFKGVYKQSGKINECLRLKSCAKFATCFCKAVKKKGCGSPK